MSEGTKKRKREGGGKNYSLLFRAPRTLEKKKGKRRKGYSVPMSVNKGERESARRLLHGRKRKGEKRKEEKLDTRL